MRKLGLAFFLVGLFWLRPVLAQTDPPQTDSVQTETPSTEPTGDLVEDRDVDAYALKVPIGVTHSVKTLANYFCQRIKTDHGKARAIFTWIDANLAYDMDSFLNPDVHLYEVRPEVILQSSDRTTVCGGHATLFATLAKASGLDSVVISGFARVIKPSSGKEVYTDTGYCYGRHAWNAVKIDGTWQLLDVTWANPHKKSAGKITADSTTDYDYFLIPAENLKYTHFPSETGWQLLDTPFTRQAQEKLPMLTPAFFKHGGKIISHPELSIRFKNTDCVMIDVDKDSSVMASLYQDDKEVAGGCTFSQRMERGYAINVMAPKDGTYELRLYARKFSAKADSWSCIATYVATVFEGRGAAYPMQYDAFWKREARLQSPLIGTLDSTKPQEFNLAAPGATRVSVICGKEFLPLEKQGDFFVGKITVKPGEVKIGAEYPEKPDWYETLLTYQAK